MGATVIDIHAIVDKSGDKSGQLPGMHAISGVATVSYPYGKGKKRSCHRQTTTCNYPCSEPISK